MTNSRIDNHEYYMHRCIELAMLAKAAGESPVGSLLIKNGEIIAEGIEAVKTHNDVTYHAEIEAIRKAILILKTQDLSDCIMYTTHEPCIMCSYVIRHTKINTVVIGTSTGELGGLSSLYPLLKDDQITKWAAYPKIVVGILEEECSRLFNK